MRCLEQLKDMAQEALGGLNAGQELRLKIQKAAREGAVRRTGSFVRPLVAVATAIVILAAAGTLLPGALRPGINPGGVNDVLDSHPAGQSTGEPFRARALLDVPPGIITPSTAASGRPPAAAIFP